MLKDALVLWLCFCCSVFCAGFSQAQNRAPGEPIRIKVVVVTMFERGEDTGDVPGEYQLWVEREHLDQILPLPSGYHHVRLNKDGVLGLLTGVGTAKAAASVMALGLDPRFDLSKAYWIVAGIGGGDPRMCRSARRYGRIMWLTATWRLKLTRDRFPRAGRPVTCRCAGERRTNSHHALITAKCTR